MNRLLLTLLLATTTSLTQAAPLGLPEVPIPANNPQSEDKIQLGDKLFHDVRFSSTGDVSCATCHDPGKAFADGLPVAEGIKKLKGTVDMIFDAVGRHYEIPDDYADPRQAEIERELERYLAEAWMSLADDVTMVAAEPSDTRETLAEKIGGIAMDPVEAFASGVRFAVPSINSCGSR